MKDLINLNKIELANKAAECKKALAQIKFDKKSGKLSDPSLPRKKRKELAQVLTRYNQLVSGGN